MSDSFDDFFWREMVNEEPNDIRWDYKDRYLHREYMKRHSDSSYEYVTPEEEARDWLKDFYRADNKLSDGTYNYNSEFFGHFQTVFGKDITGLKGLACSDVLGMIYDKDPEFIQKYPDIIEAAVSKMDYLKAQWMLENVLEVGVSVHPAWVDTVAKLTDTLDNLHACRLLTKSAEKLKKALPEKIYCNFLDKAAAGDLYDFTSEMVKNDNGYLTEHPEFVDRNIDRDIKDGKLPFYSRVEDLLQDFIDYEPAFLQKNPDVTKKMVKLCHEYTSRGLFLKNSKREIPLYEILPVKDYEILVKRSMEFMLDRGETADIIFGSYDNPLFENTKIMNRLISSAKPERVTKVFSEMLQGSHKKLEPYASAFAKSLDSNESLNVLKNIYKEPVEKREWLNKDAYGLILQKSFVKHPIEALKQVAWHDPEILQMESALVKTIPLEEVKNVLNEVKQQKQAAKEKQERQALFDKHKKNVLEHSASEQEAMEVMLDIYIKAPKAEKESFLKGVSETRETGSDEDRSHVIGLIQKALDKNEKFSEDKYLQKLSINEIELQKQAAKERQERQALFDKHKKNVLDHGSNDQESMEIMLGVYIKAPKVEKKSFLTGLYETRKAGSNEDKRHVAVLIRKALAKSEKFSEDKYLQALSKIDYGIVSPTKTVKKMVGGR